MGDLGPCSHAGRRDGDGLDHLAGFCCHRGCGRSDASCRRAPPGRWRRAGPAWFQPVLVRGCYPDRRHLHLTDKSDRDLGNRYGWRTGRCGLSGVCESARLCEFCSRNRHEPGLRVGDRTQLMGQAFKSSPANPISAGHARASRHANAAFSPCSLRMRLNSSLSGDSSASIRMSISSASNNAVRICASS